MVMKCQICKRIQTYGVLFTPFHLDKKVCAHKCWN